MKVNFFANLVNAEAPNLLLADPLTQQPLQLNFTTQTYDVEARDIRTAGRPPRLQLRRQRPAQQLRHHHRAERREPQRARRLRAGRDHLRSRAVHRRRPRRQVRQHRRRGVLAAARGDLQAARRSRHPRLVQPRVPLAVGRQQLPRHQHRRPDRPERAGAAPAAGASACRARRFRWWFARSAAGCRSAATRRAICKEESLTAYEVAYTGTLAVADDGRGGVLRQRPRRQHQLHAAAELARSVHRGQPAAGLAAAAVDSGAAGAARHLPAAHRLHLSEPRADPQQGYRALARSPRQQRR